jgi:hypothetical protein
VLDRRGILLDMPARTMLALIAIAVVCAGGVLALDSGSTGHAAGGTISLPQSLPGFKDIVAATADNAKGKKSIVESTHRNQLVVNSHTVAEYRKAYHGAAVAYRAYANADLTAFPWMIAIRTNAPGITIGPYEDPKYLGLAIAPRFVQRFGDVQCAIQTGLTTVAGHKPDLSEEVPYLCQRTANGVTVMTGGGGFEGPAGVKRLVALTDAAGRAVHG